MRSAFRVLSSGVVAIAAIAACSTSYGVAEDAAGDGGSQADAAGEGGSEAGEVDGDATTDAAVSADAGRAVTALATGLAHVCATWADGVVKCWGYNAYGQLGLGDTSTRGDQPMEMGVHLPRLDLGPGRAAKMVVMANVHTCALLDDDGVKCWGRNNSGQLGLGDVMDRTRTSLVPLDLGAPRTAKVLAAGDFHACALLDNNTVKCWGDNDLGQLGLGDAMDRGDNPGEMGASLLPVDLGGRTAKSLAAGGHHTCAILDDDTVKCWGNNIYGQLGLGDQTARGAKPGEMGSALPTVDLGPGRRAKVVRAAEDHTCAILDNDTVKCWGLNGFGQLGQGDIADRGVAPSQMGMNLPVVDLGPGRTAKALTARGKHTCVLLDDASVKCWGVNMFGELGLGDTANRGDVPGQMGANLPRVDLGPGRTAKALSAGTDFTCALLDDATVKCWGRNEYGNLGLGDTVARGTQASQMGANLLPVDLER